MKKLLGRAMALLARRDHSEYELRRKLAAQFSFSSGQKRGNDTLQSPEHVLTKDELAHQIESVIQYCYEYHWLDDKKFAESFVRIRSAKGFGPQRLELELQQKGVSREIIYSALADCELDWVKLANELIIKHFGHQDFTDWKRKAKAYNYLAYRGFYSEDISEALNNKQN
jgi:regulatory protein